MYECTQMCCEIQSIPLSTCSSKFYGSLDATLSGIEVNELVKIQMD